jgi:5'-3' exonuclease
LLTACGVCWMQAPAEAEAFCSWLVRKGYGTAVVSCDTDCIAHRADVIIFDVDSNTGVIQYVNIAELLNEWKLTELQLIDFGILCGCDYNPNSRVNKIGPATAIQLLQQYGNIDNIPLRTSTSTIVNTKRPRDASGGYAGLMDLACLQHRMIRELFNPDYSSDTLEEIKCLTPCWELIVPIVERRTDLNQKNIRELMTLVERRPTLHTNEDF